MITYFSVAITAAALVAAFDRIRYRRGTQIEKALELSRAYRGGRDVVSLARDVCDALEVDDRTAHEVELTALLHDVGKTAIPPQILDKPGELSAEEWVIMRTHAAAGQRMLHQVGRALRPVARAVRASHERWDGTGYPDGLAGEAIPFPARVVACCDALEAMTSDRPYRPAMDMDRALAELRANSGTQFDPGIVEALAGAIAVAPARSTNPGAAHSEPQAEHIAAVAQATRELARAHDGDAVREAICRAALRISGAAAAVLIEPVGEGWLAETARAGEPRSPSPVIPHEPGLEHPRFMPDARTGADGAAELGRAVGGASAHMEPILRDGTLNGVVTVSWDEPLDRVPAPIAAMMSLLVAEAAVALERADLLARLEAAARTDELTGVLKRAAWEEQLVRELARAEREGRPLCVVMLDIDHFKRFNDREGHLAGDEVLKESARAWNAELRLTDQLGRYGGDEFLALLPGCTLDDGNRLVERLSPATAARQTCSAGIAEWDGEETWQNLLRRADDALLSAKQRGRNQIALAA